MRIIRFSQGESTKYGVFDGERISELEGKPFEAICETGNTYELEDVSLLAPVEPKKIVLVGLNFASHAAEIHQQTPKEPLIFFKPTSAIVASEETIELPVQSGQVEIEAELTVVIGKTAKNVPQEQVSDHILGYTIANDVTARDIQFSDLQWARSKAFDTFCPVGPWIETEFDPSNKRISSTINGETKQDASTSEMVYSPEYLVSYISQNFTLEPGDIILTGSPAGISKIASGDRVECTIEGIGTLVSLVK
jgi:2-keto-4-pentenoate hydratase/2-oxohepta-3-ene-1,7-dioic acid hydratase in catechol pathway